MYTQHNFRTQAISHGNRIVAGKQQKAGTETIERKQIWIPIRPIKQYLVQK